MLDMSVIQNILARIDTKLNSIIMIKHPVWFFGSAVTDDADDKMREFSNICNDSTIGTQEMQSKIDNWLTNYDEEQKREFCSRMYARTWSRDGDATVGRRIIKAYCASNKIQLNEFQVLFDSAEKITGVSATLKSVLDKFLAECRRLGVSTEGECIFEYLDRDWQYDNIFLEETVTFTCALPEKAYTNPGKLPSRSLSVLITNKRVGNGTIFTVRVDVVGGTEQYYVMCSEDYRGLEIIPLQDLLKTTLQTERAFGLSGIFLRLCTGRFWDYVKSGLDEVGLPLDLLSAFVDSPLERPEPLESLDIIPHLRHEEGVNLDKYTSYEIKSNWIKRTESEFNNTNQVPFRYVINIMETLCHNLLLDCWQKTFIIQKLHNDLNAFYVPGR